MSCIPAQAQAVRALAASPTEHSFASGAADNLKKFKLPQGDFLHNFLQQQRVSRCFGVVSCSERALASRGQVCTAGNAWALLSYHAASCVEQTLLPSTKRCEL